MANSFKEAGLFSMAERNYLRLEAMDLFERCLTEGTPDFLLDFIEEQIAHTPPRLDLLNELAEDLHQRLLALRESHFDVRDRVLRTVRNDFQVDLSPVAPPNALDTYHRLEPDHLLTIVRRQNPQLSSPDLITLRRVLEAAQEMASQLHEDVAMTEELLFCVMDWADGLSVIEARREWFVGPYEPPDDFVIRIH